MVVWQSNGCQRNSQQPLFQQQDEGKQGKHYFHRWKRFERLKVQGLKV